MGRFRRRLSNVCKSKYGDLKGAIPSDFTLGNVLVSNRYKTLFCYVPKVACSNWKRVFLVLSGYNNSMAQISGPMAHESGLLDTLDRYSYDEINQKLQTYKKILFVREPLERVLSAYRNKFTTEHNINFHQRYGIKIIKKYRLNFTREPSDDEQVKFNEFVKYLLHLRPDQLHDKHWELQHKICSPCSINYDFIGRYETLKSDAARALEMMGASGKAAFPDIGKGKTGEESKTLMKEFYSQISQEEFVQLTEMYKMDYLLFNYHKPSYFEVVGRSPNY